MEDNPSVEVPQVDGTNISYEPVHTDVEKPKVTHTRTFHPIVIKMMMLVGYYFVGLMVFFFVEKWTVISSLYFITYSLATVGYGTPAPVTEFGRIFTTFYLLGGCAIILNIPHKLTRYSITYCQEWMIHCYFKIVHGRVAGISQKDMRGFKITLTLISFGIALVAGMLFFSSNQPGWTLIMGLYWTAQTMTAVGYGDLEVNESSRLFAIFFILWCCGIYAAGVYNIFDMWAASRREQLASKRCEGTLLTEAWARRVVTQHKGVVSRDLLVLEVLKFHGFLDWDEDVLPLMEIANQGKQGRSGPLLREDLIRALHLLRHPVLTDDQGDDNSAENPMHSQHSHSESDDGGSIPDNFADDPRNRNVASNPLHHHYKS